jgi:hypothetical protein
MADEKIVRSAADVAKAWKAFEADLARQRKNHEEKGEVFIGLTKEGFERKMKRVESPMIGGQSWTASAAPGGTINFSVWNPDPFGWQNLAVSVSIGNRNAIVSNDEFMTTFDGRFPTYAKPQPFGFSLAAGAQANQAFALKIPAGIEKAQYFGNACLLKMDFFDVGKYLDRALFFFEVV